MTGGGGGHHAGGGWRYRRKYLEMITRGREKGERVWGSGSEGGGEGEVTHISTFRCSMRGYILFIVTTRGVTYLEM